MVVSDPGTTGTQDSCLRPPQCSPNGRKSHPAQCWLLSVSSFLPDFQEPVTSCWVGSVSGGV